MNAQVMSSKCRRMSLATSAEAERVSMTFVRDGEVLSKHLKFIPPQCQELVLRTTFRRMSDFYGAAL